MVQERTTFTSFTRSSIKCEGGETYSRLIGEASKGHTTRLQR